MNNEKINEFGKLLEAKTEGLKENLLQIQKQYKNAASQSERDYYASEIYAINALIDQAYETKSQYVKMFYCELIISERSK